MFDEDEHVEAISAWPSFVDLLASTVLLLLALVAVMIVVVTPGDQGALKTWRSNLIALLKSQPAYGQVFDVDTTDGLWVGVVLRAEATFPVGRFEFSELTTSGRDALRDVANALKKGTIDSLVREVRIIGHTDASPFRDATNSFSNWELSASRAAAVARYLAVEQGISPCLLSAVGKGSHFPFPWAGGQRQPEKDRRIEIQIVPDVKEALLDKQERCDAIGDGTAQVRR